MQLLGAGSLCESDFFGVSGTVAFVQLIVVQYQQQRRGDCLGPVGDDHAGRFQRLHRRRDLALGGGVEMRGALVNELRDAARW